MFFSFKKDDVFTLIRKGNLKKVKSLYSTMQERGDDFPMHDAVVTACHHKQIAILEYLAESKNSYAVIKRELDYRVRGFSPPHLNYTAEHALIGSLVTCVTKRSLLDPDLLYWAIRNSPWDVVNTLLYNNNKEPSSSLELSSEGDKPAPILACFERTNKEQAYRILRHLWELTIKLPCNVDVETLRQHVKNWTLVPEHVRNNALFEIEKIEAKKNPPPRIMYPSIPTAGTNPSRAMNHTQKITPRVMRHEEPQTIAPRVMRHEEPQKITPRVMRHEEPQKITPRVMRHEEPQKITPRVMRHEEPQTIVPRVMRHEEPQTITPRVMRHEEPQTIVPRFMRHEEPQKITPRVMRHEEPQTIVPRFMRPLTRSECSICGEVVSLVDVPRCNHSLCALCFERCVRGDIEIGRLTQCPICLSNKDQNCILSYEMMAIGLDKDAVEAAASAEFRRATANLTFCDNCQNPFEKGNVSNPICPYCKKDPKSKQDAEADRSFAAYRKTAGAFPCNECGEALELSSACNKLKCRCGALNCWWCTKSIDNGYDHFKLSKCPLYVPSRGVLPRLTHKTV